MHFREVRVGPATGVSPRVGTVKHFWGSLLIGVVLLGGLVAFALVLGSGGSEETPDGAAYDEAADAEALADRTACRAYLLGVDRSGVERSVGNLNESLAFERARGDGGLGFSDWLDADRVSRSLLAVADSAQTAAATPGSSGEVFDVLRRVMAAASSLEESAVSGSTFFVDEVDSALFALTDALGEARDVCA